MKTKRNLVCGLMAVILSLAFVTCDNGGGTGNNPGNNPQRVTYTGNNDSDTYTLVITENTSRAYTPVNGDTYKLTLTGGKTSTGTIVISGGTITLTPSKGTGTITVEVLGTVIISISKEGTPNWDNNDVFTAPGTLSNRTVGNPYLGNKLVLSGQVYVEKWSEDGNIVSYEEKFDGDLELSSSRNGGGSGEVKDGQLSFTIETPNLRDGDIYFYWGEVKLSDDTVKIFFLWSLEESFNNILLRGNQTFNVVGNTVSGTREEVRYVYVDGDVIWSGKGMTFQEIEDGVTLEGITKDFSFQLKEGWNVIYSKQEYSGTITGTMRNPTSGNITINVTTSLGEPSGLKWIMPQ